MAKVYGITPLELRPGIQGEDFERFFKNEYAPLGLKLGWIAHVLKADRGVRAGKYAVMWEIPSVELRNRYSPSAGFTEEALQIIGPGFDAANGKLDTFVMDWPGTLYVEIV